MTDRLTERTSKRYRKRPAVEAIIDSLRPPDGVTPGLWRQPALAKPFVCDVDGGFVAETIAEADAAHIARWDPDTVNEVLDALVLALTALDEIIEGDECLRGLPDDEPADCPCAHHWTLRRRALVLALLDQLTREAPDA